MVGVFAAMHVRVDRGIGQLRRLYLMALDVVLRHRLSFGGLAVALFIGGFALVFIKRLGEETVDGLTGLAAPGPDDAMVVQIIYQGKIFVAFLVRNFVDADFPTGQHEGNRVEYIFFGLAPLWATSRRTGLPVRPDNKTVGPGDPTYGMRKTHQ